MDLAADVWLGWIWENTVVGAAMAALVWAICRWLRPRAAVCHALWLCVAIKLVAPPVVLWSWFLPGGDPRDVASEPVRSAAVATDATTAREGDPVVLPPHEFSGFDVYADAASNTVAVPLWGLALWALGAACLICGWWRRTRRFRAIARGAAPPPLWFRREVRALCSELGLRVPQVAIVPGLAAPCAGGLRRPRVFWSTRLLDPADRHKIRAVLGHELAHLKRRDPWVAAGELVAGAVWWWHPLFWLVRHQLHEYSELACDAWALELTDVSPRTYADTLIDFNEPAPAARLAGIAGFGGRRDMLRRRLIRVMRGESSHRLPRSAVAGIAVAVLCTLPSWTCREVPLVQLVTAVVSPAPEPPPPPRGAATDPADDLPRTTEPETVVVEPPRRVDPIPVLTEMIRWRVRKRDSTSAIARDLVDALESSGPDVTRPVAALRQLADSRDRRVAAVATRALSDLGQRQ